VLAVKPQVMDAVLVGIDRTVRSACFVSIAAGVPTARLEAGLGAAPASCARCRTRRRSSAPYHGRGAREKATAADERIATALFGGVARWFRVRDETLMDAVTGFREWSCLRVPLR